MLVFISAQVHIWIGLTDFPPLRVTWMRESSNRSKVWPPFRTRRRDINQNLFIYQSVQIPVFTLYFSKKEKKDVEDLEIPETKRLFLEQNTLDAKKSKEQKEYLDALNKEVI